MPTLTRTIQGTVTGIWGSALIRGNDGKMKRLNLGDVVHQGDQILTTQNGIVQLTPPEGARPTPPTQLAETPPEFDFDKLPGPAAGPNGGDSGSLLEGFRVGRITEALTPASLAQAPGDGGLEFTRPVPNEARNPPGDGTGALPPAGEAPAPAPTPANLPPSALPASVSGPEDATLPTPLRGQDSDGTVTSITVTSLPTQGTLLLADGVTPVVAGVPLTPEQAAGLVFRPAPDFNGTAQIQFTVTDNSGDTSAPARVDIQILPVNDLPLARNDLASTPEDTPISFSPATLLANDSDPDGNPLTLVSVQQPSHGTVAVVNGQVVFTPEADYTGPASFTYTVSDGQGGTSTAVVAINVLPVNDAPVARDDANGVTEDGASTTLVVGAADGVILSAGSPASRDTDVDGDRLSVVAVRTGPEAAGGLAGSVGGALAGTYGALTLNADGSYTYALNNASPAVQSLNAGQVVNDVFTYTVSDGHGGTDTATLSIQVTGSQDQPLARNDLASTPEDTPVSFSPATLLANDSDPDGNPLTLVSVQEPSHGTVAVVNGQVVFTPEADYTGPASFTYTVSDGQGGTSTAVVAINVLPVNDAPVARDDANGVTEDGASTTLVVGAADGVILSAGSPASRDTDVDGDRLSVVAVRTGPEAAGGLAGSVGGALAGTYGALTLNADGSYTYVLNNASPAVQNLNAGQVVNDVFTYTVSDGHGGTDTATLSIQVTGSQDLTAGPPSLTPVAAGGLNGSYYGYNEATTTAPGARTHADDGTATFGRHGNPGNLNSAEDVYGIVNGRNALAGGPDSIAGSSASAHTGAADVTFQAHHLDYGFSPVMGTALGSNTPVAPGAALPPGDGNGYSQATGLGNFLGQDAAGAVVQTGAGNTNGTSGLGTTTDAAVRLSGQIYVQPGTYDFRVTADDGFRLTVAGETLLEYDGNQWPTSRVFTNVPLGDLGGGLQSFELLYWEQGGVTRLRVEYKPSGSPASEYQVMSDTNTALFSDAAAPVLADPRIQDLVFENGGWQIRTGSMLDGDAGNNTLVGGVSRDLLRGGDGSDLLQGGGGADQLEGGNGNDALQGGTGSDLLFGGAGADTVAGGLGDDTYRLSDDQDTLVENSGEGIDAIQLDATYVASHTGSTYTLAANFENLSAQGDGAINLTGNAADNRLEGNSADNRIDGGDGRDFLIGGDGNDVLTGGAGADVFAWHLADEGAPGAPAIDTITDFRYGGGYQSVEAGSSGTPIGGGDVLDLRDLLRGEHTSVGNLGQSAGEQVELSNLQHYIDVEVSDGNTVLHISSRGGFADDTFNPAAEDERIVLQGVDLYAATGVSSGNEALLLQTLIKNGTMVVD